MKNNRRYLLVLLLAAFSIPVFAATEQKLVGTFELAGKTLVDAPESEPKNTHFRIYLAGEAAQSMYQAMQVKATSNECLMDGSLSKTIGGTSCTQSAEAKTYSCSFAINLKTQQTEPALAC